MANTVIKTSTQVKRDKNLLVVRWKKFDVTITEAQTTDIS